MDYSMQLVQNHCAKYLEMFAECMQDFPYTWQSDCERERSKLARCAETNPEILHIKTTCRQEFQSYEECMENNQVQPEKCTLLFETFNNCADKALLNIPGTNYKGKKSSMENSQVQQDEHCEKSGSS